MDGDEDHLPFFLKRGDEMNRGTFPSRRAVFECTVNELIGPLFRRCIRGCEDWVLTPGTIYFVGDLFAAGRHDLSEVTKERKTPNVVYLPSIIDISVSGDLSDDGKRQQGQVNHQNVLLICEV